MRMGMGLRIGEIDLKEEVERATFRRVVGARRRRVRRPLESAGCQRGAADSASAAALASGRKRHCRLRMPVDRRSQRLQVVFLEQLLHGGQF